MSKPTIESVSREARLFPPAKSFAERAEVGSMSEYRALHERSLQDPEGFWRERANVVHWFKAPTRVLSGQLPEVKWFEDGTTNVSYNCLDRHVNGPRADKTAILFEGEPGDVRRITYRELWRDTQRVANVLTKLGVKKGDRVAIYMGMVPEAAVAMLACTRIGAIHSVIFGGFAADAIRDRVNDAQAKLVITQDGSNRRGQITPLKENVDRALEHCPSVTHTLVLRRCDNPIEMRAGRDVDWETEVSQASDQHQAVEVGAEDPLFILYTSGSTGKPKGVMHTTGGYLVHTTLSTRYVFDLKEDDLYWCTADIGWVTGHSYIVYGPLSNGVSVLMYEGVPNFPNWERIWSIIERHRATIFYTAPTAIRAFIRAGDDAVNKHDLSSLRLLGSVGEPINPEAWIWYHRTVGKEKCPIVDTWWQTETGGIMMSPLPGAVPTKPGSCTVPLFGVSAKILREDGSQANANEGGLLVIDKPWPSMLRSVWGDHQRFLSTYFSTFEGKYFTGDGARRDEDGYFWVMGRVDDVVNVSGHRLGTAEIESALVAHPSVAEAAVVGKPDDLKGQALVAFVTLKQGKQATAELKHELAEHVAQEIGRFAKPDAIRLSEALPKTRSGKIMRRLLKEIASGQAPKGDVTTLEDYTVLAKLSTSDE
ncbi:MAG: acetate--CoA ligase [Myxococcales bacterium]